MSKRRATLFLLTLAAVGAVRAQTPSGSITGIVTDQTGTPVYGANISLTNRDSGLLRKLTTSSEGSFSTAALTAGVYLLTVERSGFQLLEGNATVEARTTTSVNLTLQVGEMNVKVTVTDAVPLLHYDHHQVGGVVGNIVPTGLAVSGNTVYMAEAGQVPHLPQDGKVVSFEPQAPTVTQVASGASLLVDVEFGRGQLLYALSQGTWSGGPPGSPALPNTGALVEVNEHGSFDVILSGLDRPTSLEFIGNTAYVVTLTGEIWRIESVSAPPFAQRH